VAPIPAPLPVPRITLGFPSLTMAGGQIACPGGRTTPKIEAGGQTVRPGGQTIPRTNAGG
jgi:hypothetical protein